MPRKIMKSDKYVDDVAPARPKKAGVMKSQSTHSAMKKGMWRDSNWKPIRDMTFLQYINSLRTQNAKKNPATTIANAGITKPKLPPPMPAYNNSWANQGNGNNTLPKRKPIQMPVNSPKRKPIQMPGNSSNWQEPFDPKNPYHEWQKKNPNILIQPIFQDWDKKNPRKGGFQL